jgi:hypothetical protein
MVNGDSGAEALHTSADRVLNVRNKKTTLITESLKLTAVIHSLSQIYNRQRTVFSDYQQTRSTSRKPFSPYIERHQSGIGSIERASLNRMAPR